MTQYPDKRTNLQARLPQTLNHVLISSKLDNFENIHNMGQNFNIHKSVPTYQETVITMYHFTAFAMLKLTSVLNYLSSDAFLEVSMFEEQNTDVSPTVYL